MISASKASVEQASGEHGLNAGSKGGASMAADSVGCK